jgi:hypothetical protein
MGFLDMRQLSHNSANDEERSESIMMIDGMGLAPVNSAKQTHVKLLEDEEK